MLALGDALAMVLLEARGFDKDDFARFHPGGHARAQSLVEGASDHASAREYGHRLAGPESHRRGAGSDCPQARAGAAVVVDGDGRLAGIFTHGDFARHFQRGPETTSANGRWVIS